MTEAVATSQALAESAKGRLRVIVESYYDVLDQRIRTDHRVRNHSEYEGLCEALGRPEARRYRLEGPATYRKAVKDNVENVKFIEGVEQAKKELEGWHEEMNKVMSRQEYFLKKLAMKEIEHQPIWTEWLSNVKGIGPCLAGGLLSWVDLWRTKHTSSLWKYFGLAVVAEEYFCLTCQKTFTVEEVPEDEHGHYPCPQCKGQTRSHGHAERRVRGEKVQWNPKAKTLAYKIGEQFVRTVPSKYRELYDAVRLEVDQKPCRKVHKDEKTGKVIPCFDKHRHMKAMRMTAKIFLSHFYLIGRTLMELPVSKPFPFGVLGKDPSEYIVPRIDEGTLPEKVVSTLQSWGVKV